MVEVGDILGGRGSLSLLCMSRILKQKDNKFEGVVALSCCVKVEYTIFRKKIAPPSKQHLFSYACSF